MGYLFVHAVNQQIPLDVKSPKMLILTKFAELLDDRKPESPVRSVTLKRLNAMTHLEDKTLRTHVKELDRMGLLVRIEDRKRKKLPWERKYLYRLKLPEGFDAEIIMDRVRRKFYGGKMLYPEDAEILGDLQPGQLLPPAADQAPAPAAPPAVSEKFSDRSAKNTALNNTINTPRQPLADEPRKRSDPVMSEQEAGGLAHSWKRAFDLLKLAKSDSVFVSLRREEFYAAFATAPDDVPNKFIDEYFKHKNVTEFQSREMFAIDFTNAAKLCGQAEDETPPF